MGISWPHLINNAGLLFATGFSASAHYAGLHGQRFEVERAACDLRLYRDGCLIVHRRFLLSGCVGRFGPQPIRRKLRGNFAGFFEAGTVWSSTKPHPEGDLL